MSKGLEVDRDRLDALVKKQSAYVADVLKKHALDLVDLMSQDAANSTAYAYAEGLKDAWKQRDSEVAALRELVTEAVEQLEFVRFDSPPHELIARMRAVANG